ncbi:uncharacterized protein LOC113315264 [Papaver somniferum]|uniref:uncharacterized protein LOC113315264 n=1 Tax=Papaver somniferum TaxID=3469 RepID=UPI000E700F3B|nr:uncharacterized protein LOC113315264 [Papaver somniferum]XP_026419354.1 uncharacterized protein LOC113315264 [Papaver somniferum]
MEQPKSTWVKQKVEMAKEIKSGEKVACQKLDQIVPQSNQALTLKDKFGSVLWFLWFSIGGDHQYYFDMILVKLRQSGYKERYYKEIDKFKDDLGQLRWNWRCIKMLGCSTT